MLPFLTQVSRQPDIVTRRVIVYNNMGLDWAIGLFGFVILAMLLIRVILFKFGRQTRAKRKQETVEY